MKSSFLLLTLVSFFSGDFALAHDAFYLCRGICSTAYESKPLTAQARDPQVAFAELEKECKSMVGQLKPISPSAVPSISDFCQPDWR